MAYTRAAIAATVARALRTLASDAGFTITAASDGQTEGDFTDAIDAGLRAVGAVNQAGDIDVSLITTANIDDLLQVVQRGMLERLQIHYAGLTDYTLGQREEKLSQIATAIGRLNGSGGSGASGGGGSGGRIIVRPLRRENRDYDLS